MRMWDLRSKNFLQPLANLVHVSVANSAGALHDCRCRTEMLSSGINPIYNVDLADICTNIPNTSDVETFRSAEYTYLLRRLWLHGVHLPSSPSKRSSHTSTFGLLILPVQPTTPLDADNWHSHWRGRCDPIDLNKIRRNLGEWTSLVRLTELLVARILAKDQPVQQETRSCPSVQGLPQSCKSTRD